ncbi:MAG: hypothetical protein ACI8XO_000801 [Verrucomicrobiales bacterium]|jgi:hypothetical protein
MKTIFQLLLCLGMQLPAIAAHDLSPGKAFPTVTLPSIESGEETLLGDQFGKKLVLHLFASW